MVNFDEPVVRQNTYSYKWDSPDSGRPDYPLWVADMDFATAPCIIEALHRRVDHGVFGYVTIPDDYRLAVCSWFSRRHGWDIAPDRIIAAPGIVPALTALLRHLSEQGRSRVLIQSPAYNMFFASVRNAGCELSETRLLCVDGHYEIDWEDTAQKMADTDVFLLCNPHNPTGRVWTMDELRRIAALCREHGVLLVSDEIHAEFVFSPYQYTPVAKLAEGQAHIVFTSAGKAFNIAGLPMATLIASDNEVKQTVESALWESCLEDVGIMGLVATISAYREGEKWLNELVSYLEGNYRALCAFFAERHPELAVTRMEGTYLAWVDLRPICGTDTESWCRMTQQKTGVKLNPGEMYGGAGYIRINMACPRKFLLEALTRAFA